MAEQLFRLRVLSPLGTAFQGTVRSATLPTPEGEITILAHHMPMVAVLADGEMLVNTGQKEVSIAIAGGFLETGLPGSAAVAGGLPAPGTAAAGPAATGPAAGPAAPGLAAAGPSSDQGGLWEATVLSDFAAESDSIEIARVEAAKARAEQLLVEKKERAEILMVERDMQRAILQLKVAEKTRTRRRRS